MFLPDVNVLVAAHRPSHPHHQVANTWLSEALNGSRAVTLPDAVWSGFVRIVTHRRVFERPSTLDESLQFLRVVISAPAAVPTPRTGRELDHFESACRDAGATGALVPDAYLAALALGLGATLVTFDRDFRRFDRLRLLELSSRTT
ncbi:PIN domain-containing protein [Cellulosimicrobium terreum]|nr:PIN domain-containing protein [Cellulosimicrobium terreum]